MPNNYSNKTPLEKAEYADDTKEMLINTLKTKGYPIVSSNSFRDVVNIVNNNTTIVNTASANATASDIAYGRRAFVNGYSILGTVNTTNSGAMQLLSLTSKQWASNDTEQYFMHYGTLTRDMFFKSGAQSGLIINYSDLVSLGHITAENIKSGITIFGVTGNVTELKGQTKSVNPTKTLQTITPDSSYTGLTSVTINAVNSSIDSNISAANIKSGVNILGVTGTFEGQMNIMDGYKFRGSKFTAIPSIINTANWAHAQDMSNMFSDCSNLSTVLGRQWNTFGSTNMSHFFYNCSNLSWVETTNWTINLVSNMSSMFENCSNLSTLRGLNTWNVQIVNNMSNMFQNCVKLTDLGNISQWNLFSANNITRMFWGTNLTNGCISNIVNILPNASQLINSDIYFIGIKDKLNIDQALILQNKQYTNLPEIPHYQENYIIEYEE